MLCRRALYVDEKVLALRKSWSGLGRILVNTFSHIKIPKQLKCVDFVSRNAGSCVVTSSLQIRMDWGYVLRILAVLRHIIKIWSIVSGEHSWLRSISNFKLWRLWLGSPILNHSKLTVPWHLNHEAVETQSVDFPFRVLKIRNAVTPSSDKLWVTALRIMRRNS